MHTVSRVLTYQPMTRNYRCMHEGKKFSSTETSAINIKSTASNECHETMTQYSNVCHKTNRHYVQRPSSVCLRTISNANKNINQRQSLATGSEMGVKY